MWFVIKFDRKKVNFLKEQLKKNFGPNHKIYCPKILVQYFRKNKLIKKELNLLGDYLFYYNKNFSKDFVLNKIKYTRGVKYLLKGFDDSQKEINEFVKKCQNLENFDGYISQNIFEAKVNQFYKFSSGPFTQKIFQLIDLQKNKLKILMGNIITTIDKRNYLISSL